MSRCPICKSSELGSGYVTAKLKNRDDNTYFNGTLCDPCWDNIQMPLLRGDLRLVREALYELKTR